MRALADSAAVTFRKKAAFTFILLFRPTVDRFLCTKACSHSHRYVINRCQTKKVTMNPSCSSDGCFTVRSAKTGKVATRRALATTQHCKIINRARLHIFKLIITFATLARTCGPCYNHFVVFMIATAEAPRSFWLVGSCLRPVFCVPPAYNNI